MSDWHERSGYEVVGAGGNWAVVVLGGDYSNGEPAWRPVAGCSDRDEAFRIRDALRATLDATRNDPPSP